MHLANRFSSEPSALVLYFVVAPSWADKQFWVDEVGGYWLPGSELNDPVDASIVSSGPVGGVGQPHGSIEVVGVLGEVGLFVERVGWDLSERLDVAWCLKVTEAWKGGEVGDGHEGKELGQQGLTDGLGMCVGLFALRACDTASKFSCRRPRLELWARCCGWEGEVDLSGSW